MSYLRYLAVSLGVVLLALGSSARAAEPLKVCVLSGSDTYRSDLSLPPFIEFLEKHYDVRCTLLEKKAVDDLPGLEQLDDCDVALVYIKRMKLAGDQLARFQKFAQSGKPIVGVRTASHAVQTWLEFDQQVLGGNYHGHYPVGPVTKIAVPSGAESHPILKGVSLTTSADALYKNDGHAKDIQILQTGTIPDNPTEALTWTREVNGGRVFYTSLGSQEIFETPDFRRMLAQALFWAARLDVVEKK
jgi:type 1 glutamine amidotransferase